ncbi:glycosyltransferase family 2 protein [Blastococcus sp. TF02A-26]|uniref:glycosyltransferase family 2 protein n=1 Tax=Blastococcus sp. TF02A-26 TaxID=2250577 RepID=UPI001314C227|nr:glycosyltransferase [Blastococcus sp. TF02A-26]
MTGRRPVAVGAVIPCKNEVETITRCLAALRGQQPPLSRIVVVDNGSTDGSVELAKQFADTVLEVPDGSISGLRNRGAAELAGVDVIAFVDADTEVGSNWLQAGLEALGTGADLVGSRTRAGDDARWVARRWAAIEAARTHSRSRVWSQHMLVRASRFHSVGGFADIPTGEDADLSIRIAEAGGPVTLVPGMQAIHHGFPATLRTFLRRERWHTRAPGWFPRMARGSQILVAAGAVWSGAGAILAVDALVRRRTGRLRLWAATSAIAVPALGTTTSRRPAAVLQDGLLLSIWTAIRVARLPAEMRHDRIARNGG